MADTTAELMQGDPQKGAAAPPPVAAGGASGGWWPAFRDYLLETRGEIRRITWPSQDIWVNSSVITLLTILTLSLLMAIYNAVFNFVAGWLFS